MLVKRKEKPKPYEQMKDLVSGYRYVKYVTSSLHKGDGVGRDCTNLQQLMNTQGKGICKAFQTTPAILHGIHGRSD